MRLVPARALVLQPRNTGASASKLGAFHLVLTQQACMQAWQAVSDDAITLVTPRYEEVLLLGPERLRLAAGSGSVQRCLMWPCDADDPGHNSSCRLLLMRTPRSGVPAAAKLGVARYLAHLCFVVSTACCRLRSIDPGRSEQTEECKASTVHRSQVPILKYLLL